MRSSVFFNTATTHFGFSRFGQKTFLNMHPVCSLKMLSVFLRIFFKNETLRVLTVKSKNSNLNWTILSKINF